MTLQMFSAGFAFYHFNLSL